MNVQQQQFGSVACIEFATDKLNVLSHALREALYTALTQALSDESVTSIVLYGGEKAFSAGADISEFAQGTHLKFPSLHDLVNLISDAPKTIVAAVAGQTLGGGLELALACHVRVIDAKAKLALPEVHLGLLPGAAGTQLLPRYIGVSAALNAISTGKPLKLADLTQTQLFVGLSQGQVQQDAIAWAEVNPQPVVHIKHTQVANAEAEVLAAARAKLGSQGPAIVHTAILDAIQAATEHDFAQGFAKEQALFQALTETDISKSLRHAFFAERMVKNVPGLNSTIRAQHIQNVAVIGAGTMGSGIAICFLKAGFKVTLIETQQAGLDRGLGLIGKYFSQQVERGRLSAEKAAAIQTQLTTSLDYADLAHVELALEAVFEDWDVKTAVLQKMDQYLPQGAILASNTSTLDLNQLAQVTKRPEAVVGLHFFSPAQVMPLLEVVRTAHTNDQTLLTALDLGKRLGKVAVVAGVCDGFIGNRMLNEYLRIAGLLIDAGASPYQIDQALENFGMAMGPFRMCDMAGNDIGYLIRKQQLKANPNKKLSGIADLLCEQQRLGQKTQKGWYDYSTGNRRGEVDQEVLALIETYRQQQAITPQQFTDAEIVARCINALALEGYRLLEEGIALRESDIDVVYLAGYGFPRWRGGPMFFVGANLNQFQQQVNTFAQDAVGDASFWQLPNILSQKLSA